MKTENFISKIEEIKKKNSLDLSAAEDLSVGLMNLIGLEEHSFFSYIKTKEQKFLDILNIVRELRKKLLAAIVNKDDSESWCMSKHLLASSMRLYEVGSKMLSDGKDKEAKEMYNDAAELYGLFWKLNSKNTASLTKIEKSNSKNKKSIFDSIKSFLECCKE